MHNLTDRIAHTTVFVTPMKDRSIMKDRSDDPSNHERPLLPRSYSSLPVSLISTKHYIVIFSSRVGLVRTCDVIEVSLARVVATQCQEELKHETQSAHRLLKSGRQEKKFHLTTHSTHLITQRLIVVSAIWSRHYVS